MFAILQIEWEGNIETLGPDNTFLVYGTGNVEPLFGIVEPDLEHETAWLL